MYIQNVGLVSPYLLVGIFPCGSSFSHESYGAHHASIVHGIVDDGDGCTVVVMVLYVVGMLVLLLQLIMPE